MTKERPILFSGPMVRAILEGRKTQTRRIVKGVALDWLEKSGFKPEFVANPENGLSRYGYAGDRLWVRETWSFYRPFAGDATEKVIYRADGDYCGQYPLRLDDEVIFVNHRDKWTPSIHMPRWASRINLEITDLRIERLQDITEDDARAEGAVFKDFGKDRWGNQHPGWSMCPDVERQEHCLWTARFAFANLIDKIKGSETWDSNPFVWVVGFKKL